MPGPLRERRIVQWGIAYLGAAWLVIQVLDALSDPWGIPVPVVRGATVLLAVGLVVTLVVAWYHGERGRQRVSGTELVILGGVGVCAALLLRLTVGATNEPAAVVLPAQVETNTIAVIPFRDLSPDGSQQYFGDGLADEIISALSRDGRLRVAGRSSSFSMRDQPAGEIGTELSVASVLEGTVRTEGDRVLVQVSLVSAEDGFERWSRRFDRSVNSVLQIQAEIAAAVATQLTGTEAPLTDVGVVSRDALDLYFQARARWTRRTRTDILRAMDLFEQATDLAPEFARAFSGLADTYAVSGFYSYLSPDEAFPAARQYARAALERDPDLSDAYATIAYVDMYYERDWGTAEQGFLRAIQLAPGNAVAHQWYGNLLTLLGRHDEAVLELRQALSLEPLSIITQAALPWGLYYAREYDEALRRFEGILELDPDYELAHYWSGWAFEQLGDIDRAIESLERAVALSDSSSISVAGLARAYGLSGRTTEAELLVARLLDPGITPTPPEYEVGKAYAGIGQTGLALEWLERAYAGRALQLAFIAVDPQVDGLRRLAQVESLVLRLGLEAVPTNPAF
jgi:TolB-like protein